MFCKLSMTITLKNKEIIIFNLDLLKIRQFSYSYPSIIGFMYINLDLSTCHDLLDFQDFLLYLSLELYNYIEIFIYFPSHFSRPYLP